jgi:c-di-GMP-binding flagellar brake protein YcgR
MSQMSFFNNLGPTNSEDLIDFLVHSQGNVVLKINNRHFKTKVLTKKNERQIAVYKFNFETYMNDSIVCSFEIKDEKYFFKSSLRSTNSELLVNIPNEVFQLQRRNDFRVSIPTSLAYECEIKTINFQHSKVKVELRDLSLGGCLVSLKNASQYEIPLDCEVEISLAINEFENPSIITVAKHIKPITTNNTVQLGLQYLDPTAEFLSELQGLLVQLDRLQRKKKDD